MAQWLRAFTVLPKKLSLLSAPISLGSSELLQDFPCPITLGQQEDCEWTGKMEVELRVVERQSVSVRREKTMMEADMNQHGFNQSQVVMIS